MVKPNNCVAKIKANLHKEQFGYAANVNHVPYVMWLFKLIILNAQNAIFASMEFVENWKELKILTCKSKNILAKIVWNAKCAK